MFTFKYASMEYLMRGKYKQKNKCKESYKEEKNNKNLQRYVVSKHRFYEQIPYFKLGLSGRIRIGIKLHYINIKYTALLAMKNKTKKDHIPTFLSLSLFIPPIFFCLGALIKPELIPGILNILPFFLFYLIFVCLDSPNFYERCLDFECPDSCFYYDCINIYEVFGNQKKIKESKFKAKSLKNRGFTNSTLN